ncbi:MAG: hypothetical protein IMZ59_02090 [Actinobacteria bacterium]|nr:hypothetical protein [Actinomycetota bacterium]
MTRDSKVVILKLESVVDAMRVKGLGYYDISEELKKQYNVDISFMGIKRYLDHKPAVPKAVSKEIQVVVKRFKNKIVISLVFPI